MKYCSLSTRASISEEHRIFATSSAIFGLNRTRFLKSFARSCNENLYNKEMDGENVVQSLRCMLMLVLTITWNDQMYARWKFQLWGRVFRKRSDWNTIYIILHLLYEKELDPLGRLLTASNRGGQVEFLQSSFSLTLPLNEDIKSSLEKFAPAWIQTEP